MGDKGRTTKSGNKPKIQYELIVILPIYQAIKRGEQVGLLLD